MRHSVHLPKNTLPLVLAPEAASDKIIVEIGRLLGENGIYFRSGVILKGRHELVDLLYKSGPTNKTDRVNKLSKNFASYWEYNALPVAILMLEDAEGDATKAHKRLNELKGTSNQPIPGTLRGISSLTQNMYSYVHVPDEDIVEDILSWALPDPAALKPLDRDGNHYYWVMLKELLSFQNTITVESSEELQQLIFQHVLRMLLLSNMDVILDRFPADSLALLLEGGSMLDMGMQQAREFLREMKTVIPSESYAGRRLKLLIETVSLILNPQRRIFVNAVDLPDLLDYVGVSLHPSKLQLLIASFLPVHS